MAGAGEASGGNRAAAEIDPAGAGASGARLGENLWRRTGRPGESSAGHQWGNGGSRDEFDVRNHLFAASRGHNQRLREPACTGKHAKIVQERTGVAVASESGGDRGIWNPTDLGVVAGARVEGWST